MRDENASQILCDDHCVNLATQLSVLASGAGIEVFRDPEGTAWASLPTRDHRETHPIGSLAVSGWLRRLYRQVAGEVAGAEVITNVTADLAARAQDGPVEEVYVRRAMAQGKVYLDLGDIAGRCVEIGPDGWSMVTDPPVRFYRPHGLQELPEPSAFGSLASLHPYLNLGSEEDWILLSSWLLGALAPHGPYPILLLAGEQGSAKSVTARILQALVDPRKAALRSEPHDVRELMIGARNSWLLTFDNLSGMEPWLADALCRLSTGAGFATRRLYTDSDEVLIEAARPVILTSIGDVASRGDLLNRAISLTLPSLPEGARRSEEELFGQFEEDCPSILGALCTAVAGALRQIQKVYLPVLPRMADFSRWVVAAEQAGALPWQSGRFLEVYTINRSEQHHAVLEASPLAQAVLKLLAGAGGGLWNGTASELHTALERHVDEATRRSRSWPASSRGVANALRRIAPHLRSAAGIETTFGAREGGSGRRLIELSGGDL